MKVEASDGRPNEFVKQRVYILICHLVTGALGGWS